MKKIVLLLTILAAAFSTAVVSAQVTDTIVPTTPTNRNVLLEVYTTTGCMFCPDAHRRANELAAANPGRVNVINVYENHYSANVYTTEFGTALVDQTNSGGYPSGTVNRHVFSGSSTSLGRGEWANRANQIMAMPSPVNIAAEGTLDAENRTVKIRIQLYYTANQTVSSNSLNIAVIQDNVLGPQSGGASYNPSQMVGDQYNHTCMLRHLINGQWGETINTISQGTLVERTYEYVIPEQLGSPNPIDAVLQNLRFVAFVCEGNQEVLTSIEVPIQTQHSYTVADGTQSNSNSPIYTGYSDNFLRNQVIYPASMLYDMEGAEISGSTGTSAQRFLTHSDPSYTALYNSGGSLSLSNPGSGYRVSYRDNLRLRGQCISGGCDRANVAVTDITDSTALLHFTAGDGASGIELQFKRAVDSAFTALTATGNTFRLTGLYHNTKYIVRVRSLCGDSLSNWKEVNFTTPAKLYPRIYVSVGGTGDGGSWATAAGDLNWAVSTADAIRSAFETSPEVWVAEGVYYGDGVSANAFTMVEGVDVYGGFAGTETELSQSNLYAHPSILDGQHTQHVLNQPAHFKVRTIWDGFTIRNGYTTDNGGGAQLKNKSSLYNCTIIDNTASRGGGVYNYSGSTVIENTTIVNNSASTSGAGLRDAGPINQIRNSIFWGNRTTSGAVSSIDQSTSNPLNCRYTAVEGGYAGEGNINLVSENIGSSPYCPRFVHPSATAGNTDTTSNADWHLQDGSICVNRGNNLMMSGYDNADLDYGTRILRDTVDMGCYESNYGNAPLPEYEGIIYVTEQGAGMQYGDSWANALSSIAEAQTLAQAHNAVVWVAAGTYYGNTSSGYAFSMVPGVNVYGGFAGNEPADYDLSQRDFQTNTTILDGQNARRVLVQTSNFTAATAATWDGFTIQNGRFAGYGAGVYMQQYSTLSHCIVQNNTIYYSSSTGESVTQFGAGVFSYISLSDGMRPNIISDCVIRNNSFEANSNLHGRGARLCTMGTKIIRTEICYNGGSQYYVRFVDPVNGDLRLQPTSSCINAGNSSAAIGEFDFYGNPRLNGTVDIGCDEASCNINELVEVTTCNSYTWNDITYTASGEYVQTFALPNGCDSVVTLHLTITVGIDDRDLTGMEIFPNPTSTVLNIKGENVRKIWIYNADGQIVFVKEENVGNLQRVDVSPFAAGQYIVKIELDNSRTVSRKFIVNRR